MEEMTTTDVMTTEEEINNEATILNDTIEAEQSQPVSLDTSDEHTEDVVSADKITLSEEISSPVETISKPKSDTEITEEDFRWYCVKTYNSYEDRVKKTLEAEVKRLGLSYCIREVVVPLETVLEVRNGKKKAKQRNFLAGYVLVNAAMSEQKKTKKKVIDIVTEISGVVSFVGRKNDPAALQPIEVERIFSRIYERADIATIETTFRKGDPVAVLVGPFSGFKGSVLEIFVEKQKVKVEITILGRKTPIELSLEQVQFDKPE